MSHITGRGRYARETYPERRASSSSSQRIIASGSISVNGAGQQLIGPFTLNADEVPQVGVFSTGWANGEEVEWGTEPNTGAISATARTNTVGSSRR